MELAIAPWQGVILGVDMGRLIVINGEVVTYLYKSALREPVEVPFGVVSGSAQALVY